jgi:ribonucleotide reductase alpha subunit
MDMWPGGVDKCTKRWDWTQLRADIAAHGVRNSLLVAPMPTASTAQIMGNNECFEPFTSNIYVRNVLAGEYTVINKHLVRALDALGLWNDDMRQSISAAEGSVQSIPGIPDAVKAVYKTAWEISMRTILDMSADRGVFVDQSQSLNLFSSDPTHKSLSSMHFYGWKKGLKTGLYYLRTRAATSAVKITVDATKTCSRADPDCLACSA